MTGTTFAWERGKQKPLKKPQREAEEARRYPKRTDGQLFTWVIKESCWYPLFTACSPEFPRRVRCGRDSQRLSKVGLLDFNRNQWQISVPDSAWIPNTGHDTNVVSPLCYCYNNTALMQWDDWQPTQVGRVEPRAFFALKVMRRERWERERGVESLSVGVFKILQDRVCTEAKPKRKILPKEKARMAIARAYIVQSAK